MILRIKNIAMLIDEWGGTSGLVTLEDVVEGEIVGSAVSPCMIKRNVQSVKISDH